MADLTTGERKLWLAVLLRAVEDATITSAQERVQEMIERKAVHSTTKRSRMRVTRGRAAKRRVYKGQARAWLLKGVNRHEIAERAGYDATAFDRLVKRLADNDWQPIGIDLGLRIDKLRVEDRRLAGLVP